MQKPNLDFSHKQLTCGRIIVVNNIIEEKV